MDAQDHPFLKTLLKRGIRFAVQRPFSWNLLQATLLPAARYAERARANSVQGRSYDDAMDLARQISPDLTVRNGVFKGMRYPERKAIGSSLLPKILGSYEREIQPLIERLCRQPYSMVVDIGCAEGYYAVGLAARIAGVTVYAFDINAEALRLCREMARINGVADRVITGSACDPETLRSLSLAGRTLIISDCEGYEKHLFTEQSAPSFQGHDLLIETHDFQDIGISSQVRRHFAATHTQESVQSIDDIQKALHYDYPELRGFDLATRKEILAERRPAIMEWLYLQSRDPRGT